MQFNVIDYDIIYLSYDEPNAEKNYAELKKLVPWAKRVHGVAGSDAAHKACGELSETERFIVIDGDNLIRKDFLNESINFAPGTNLSNAVISWTGYNLINGLTYGNGGIKSWTKETVKNMQTHESVQADKKAQVDFCWALEYIQLDSCMSDVENNYTPQQAWRAGFREGVKMALIEGEKPSIEDFNKVHWKNLNRLYVWLMVGADVRNGLWAILGAREGLYRTMCTDWDYVAVRNFSTLDMIFNQEFVHISEENLFDICCGYTYKLKTELGIPIDDPLTPGQSKFFKNLYTNPPRLKHDAILDITNVTKNNYDMVMITYNEDNAEENYNALKSKYPDLKRIHKVKGIHQAHIAAAEICDTDMIWIIDGDAQVDPKFDFSFKAQDDMLDYVHVWPSKNPVNGLEYGYGGIKLFPRILTKNMDTNKPDMTTSISKKFKKMEGVSCITKFNTSPFATWKSAFRECVKLSSAVIDRQKQEETDFRLNVWCTEGQDAPYGEYAIKGALQGKKYGKNNKGNYEALSKINDFDWLLDFFENGEAVEQTNDFEPDTEIGKILDRFEILYGGNLSDIRRFYIDKDLNSIFRLTDQDELRKAVVEKNLYSLARLMPEVENEFKLLDNDMYALWRLLEKYCQSSLIAPLKKLYMDQIDFDKDCISRGQLQSKKWLVDELEKLDLNLGTIFLCAGWYGSVVPLLVDKEIKFDKIRSFDIDPNVWKIAEIFNKQLVVDSWRFKAQTADIHDINYHKHVYETVKSNGEKEKLADSPDTVINTSCEHIENFDQWYENIAPGTIVILQSNNYFDVDEHVNCKHDLQEFTQSAPMRECLYEGEIKLPLYKRFMKIGIK